MRNSNENCNEALIKCRKITEENENEIKKEAKWNRDKVVDVGDREDPTYV